MKWGVVAWPCSFCTDIALHAISRFYVLIPVTINVNVVNDIPVATNDSVSTNEEMPVNIAVLTNDSDPDSDTLTNTGIVSGSGPSSGTLTLNADGVTFDYTPNVNFYGQDSFVYSISDGNGGTDTATVTIDVNGVNDLPAAANDILSTQEDTALNGNVLSNDSDADGDPLTANLGSGPTNGQLTLNEDGTFTYTPDPNFNGQDSFVYIISDGSGGTDTSTGGYYWLLLYQK